MDSNPRSLRLLSAQVPAGMTPACGEIWQVKFGSCWINGVRRRCIATVSIEPLPLFARFPAALPT
jgi:hypothetical protein